MRNVIAVVFGCLAVFVFASIAGAQTTKMKLSKLSPIGTAELKCISGEYTVQIPVPERQDVKKALLSVSYVSSATLDTTRSMLYVTLNGVVVAQKRFGAATNGAGSRFDVEIPGALLTTGYNPLTFRVSQHYANECERPCAPELWTNVDLEKSTIEMEYAPKVVPLKLSEVADFVFDPKITPSGNVNIILKDRTNDGITLAGMVTSGIARRFDYRKVVFSVSTDVVPGYDNVLVGVKKDVDEFFAKHNSAKKLEINGPYVKVAYLPVNGKADEYRALLVVTGRDKEEVKLAAETITNMTIPFPGIDEMKVEGFSLPKITQYGGRHVLTTGTIFPFEDLSIATTTMEGFNPPPLEFNFRLPADFMIKQNQYAEVVLNFSYGAGLRTDSVLNVALNGKNVRAIHLTNKDGDIIDGYKLNIPTYMFKPGANLLSFSAVMSPEANECDLYNTRNLFVTVFDSSTFYFPPMPHFVELPALELFMLNGFPFTRWPDGYETTIYLTGSDSAYIAAAFNLIGFMSQKNGYPVFGVKISLDKPDKDKGEIIVLGDLASVPAEFKERAPIKLGSPMEVPYPVIKNWDADVSFAFSKQHGGLNGDSGLIMQFASPYAEGKTALLLTALTASGVGKLSEAILDPDVSTAARGDLVLVGWGKPKYDVVSLSVGKKYTSGSMGEISKLDYYLSSYPKLYYAVIAIVILVMAFAFYYLTKRVRQARTRGER